MNITNISISRKSVWDECQYRYRYRYHLKTPSPVEEPFYFVYGKIIHKIAETYVSEKGKRRLGQVTADVLEGNIPLDEDKEGKLVYAPRLPDDYRKRMPDHLKSIQKLTEQIGTDGIVEHEFKYDLDPPHERFVMGFIDRLIQRGDNFFILDYKTSKRGRYRKTRHTVTSDLQLRTYARVVQREFGVPAKNIKAALYYLEGGNLIGASFGQTSLDSAEKELLEVYKDIESTPEDKAWGNVGDYCRRCEFRTLCPFYRMT